MTDSDLARLAEAYGVATAFEDWQGGRVEVSEATLTAVLTALGADASDPVAAREARRLERWARMLPPVLVLREGAGSDGGAAATVDVHVNDGSPVELWLELEDGGPARTLRQLENWSPPQELDGELIGEATFELPAGLPLGYHTLHARSPEREAEMRVVVTPAQLELPERLRARPGWGLAAQLYSVRSARSWGVGDLADLAELCVWSAAEHDADFLLVNPMHAAAPVEPVDPSPYLPVSRQFTNPIYLRIESVPEFAGLSPADRAEVDELRARLDAAPGSAEPGDARPDGSDSAEGGSPALDSTGLIDRDASWRAKRAALERVHAVVRTPARETSYRWFLRTQGRSLEDFARWCALAEQHGADWRSWPAELRDPRSEAVAAFAAEHPSAVDFHRWLQWLMREQLDAAQAAARRHGMAVGVLHDLAVGVDPGGADTWRMQQIYAQGVAVGAPPDAYSQTGQNWSQPPWRPDALAEAGYEPFREIVAAVFAHSGGVRIDHVAGLFRLWWVPEGTTADHGTYVYYDHEALVGILCLEAARAGAVVVGEDVGTVPQWTRDVLRGRGALGTSILWFERNYGGDGRPVPPQAWRELCLASVTTHDLPPTLGYLTGEHLRLREQLGLLTRDLDEELAAFAAERAMWLDTLRGLGLLGEPGGGEPGDGESGGEPSDDDIVLALHRFLALTPSRLRCLMLTDAVGDRRTQNQPGSSEGYPNWRIPLTDAAGAPVSLDDVFASERAARLIAAVRGRG